jgi:Gpi18-like mannosyltransferase
MADEPRTVVGPQPALASTTKPAGSGSASRGRRIAVATALVLVALAVRSVFFKYETGDYTSYFHVWYEFILDHGRFGALKYSFANYNEPYLYLLALLTYTPLGPLIGIKLISVSFDLVLGYFTYRIVRLRYPHGWVPTVAAAVVLFLPTVVLNSALWGQIDATYTSLALGGLYFVLRRRPWLACIFFGLALSFKLQVVFLFPVLLLLLLRRWVPWRALLMVPLVFVLMDLPALVVGASVSTLWSTYTGEIGLYQQLTLNAPNIYQYLGITESSDLRKLGIALTLAIVLALIAVVVVRRAQLTPTRILLAGTVSVILVPYLLPAMHERYFYLADALTVISAFYLPRRLWALPVLEQFASLMSYMPFLLATTITAGAAGGATGGGNFGRPGGGASAGSTGGSPGKGAGATSAVPAGGSPGNGTGRGVGPGAGGGAFSHGGGTFGHGTGGVGGLASHTVVSFKILSTVMLAALVLALWTAVREFRRPAQPEPSGPDRLGPDQVDRALPALPAEEGMMDAPEAIVAPEHPALT